MIIGAKIGMSARSGVLLTRIVILKLLSAFGTVEFCNFRHNLVVFDPLHTLFSGWASGLTQMRQDRRDIFGRALNVRSGGALVKEVSFL